MTVETAELAPGYRISRMLRGGWQLAGGHGAIEAERAIADMAAFVDAGVTTFDCADIYTGVEEMIGRFRERMLASAAPRLEELQGPHQVRAGPGCASAASTAPMCERIIDRSPQRLRMERLDLVQFHWWDYAVPGAVETALMLKELQREGKIDRIGGTNFDTPTPARSLDAGVPLVSMQVQYSLLDARPEAGLAALARNAA